MEVVASGSGKGAGKGAGGVGDGVGERVSSVVVGRSGVSAGGVGVKARQISEAAMTL